LSTFGANSLTPGWDAERLVAHELSHQWFGNSLTLGVWKDIWLHEGFACYAEWLWSAHSGRRSAHQHATEQHARLSTLAQDLVLSDPGPELMFDDRVYKRGALLLHALRLTVGDSCFFDVLQGWAQARAHSTVNTAAFVEFASAQTTTDLSELFDAWLNREALPQLPAAP
jgi:aminopeptidase